MRNNLANSETFCIFVTLKKGRCKAPADYFFMTTAGVDDPKKFVQNNTKTKLERILQWYVTNCIRTTARTPLHVECGMVAQQ
jgi:hypothetical protein